MDILHDTRFPMFSKSEQSFYISSPFFNVGNLDKKKEIQDSEMLAKLLKHSVNIQLALYVCYILGFEETFKTLYYNMYKQSDEDDERQPEFVQIFTRVLNGTMEIESEIEVSGSDEEQHKKVKCFASLRAKKWCCTCTPCTPCSAGSAKDPDTHLDIELTEGQEKEESGSCFTSLRAKNWSCACTPCNPCSASPTNEQIEGQIEEKSGSCFASLRAKSWGCTYTPYTPCSPGPAEDSEICLDIEQGQEEEKYSNLPFNPLLLAAERGHVELVKYFHKFNIKDDKTTTGYSCLHLASMNDHIETVSWLLENTSVHDSTNIKEQTALHLAAKYNNIEVFKSILEKGKFSNLHPKDNKWNTPLHIASEHGNVEIVKALISKCSSSITEFIKKNACSENPLHLASKNGHGEVSCQLLQWKFGDRQVFKVESFDEENRTPLHLASEKGHLKIVELLIEEYGADIKHTDKYGASPLHNACEKGHLNVVKKFLSLDDIFEVVDLKANDDQTPLHKAASNDQHEIVEELLSVQDVSKNPTDRYGNTPLHLACRYGFEKTVDKFLNPKYKCDVETLNNDGENVLHLAAKGGNIKVVETLVTRMKRVDQKNNFGRTSIDIAKSKSNDLVIEVLHRHLCFRLNTSMDNNMEQQNNITIGNLN